MNKHSVFSPSAAHIWSKCPGYVQMTKKNRDKKSNQAADEGTAAHWVLEQRLKGNHLKEGDKTPNGYEVTAEMISGARIFEDSLVSVADGATIYTECRVNIHAVHVLCFGTIDAYAVNGKTLYVRDYKFGQYPVEVRDNLQLISYAAGALEYARNIERVNIGIIQPRAYHPDGNIRSYVISMDRVNAVISQLRDAAVNAVSDNPTISTGKHCRYCEGKLVCPGYVKLTREVLNEFSVNFEVLNPTIDMMGRELTDLLAIDDVIKRRIAAVSAGLTAQLEKGGVCKNWKLNTGVGRWVWDTNTPLDILENVSGIKLSKPRTYITPKQAKTAGMSWELIQHYAKKTTGVKLVPVDVNEGIRIFGGGK